MYSSSIYNGTKISPRKIILINEIGPESTPVLAIKFFFIKLDSNPSIVCQVGTAYSVETFSVVKISHLALKFTVALKSSGTRNNRIC